MDKTQGLVAAPFAPLTDNGEINLSNIDAYASWLIKNGVRGVFINGTTGEGLSLTKEERTQIVEKWQENAAETLKVFVHVTHTSLHIAREMASHAEQNGCFAIATLPPFFYKPTSIAGLVGYCKEVASAAPNTPFYYYHMPAWTGVHFEMIDFMESAIKEIPTFRGLKYTYESLYDFGLCLFHDNRKYDVLFGRDEMLLAGLVTGTKGAVGSFYNFLGAFANRLMEDYREHNTEAAQEKQQFLREFTRVLTKNGGSIATLKAAIKFCGIDCGPARLPLRSLTREEGMAFRNDLDSIGFFNKIIQ